LADDPQKDSRGGVLPEEKAALRARFVWEPGDVKIVPTPSGAPQSRPVDDMRFRVVAWNMRQAAASSRAWGYLHELDPDIALLQEVTAIPSGIADRFSVIARRASWRDGQPQRFSTAVVAAPGACTSDPLRHDTRWVNDELERFAGNLVSTRVQMGASELCVVSVHSPAWEICPERLAGIDTSAVKLIQSRGDFNLSETFDAWPGGPRGNREYLDRMISSGYTECLRESTGQLTPTFRHSGGSVRAQIDHIFVSSSLANSLVTCDVGPAERVFGGGLSDHLPIIANFDI
jgi:endonuclease/exonuclease/phosphatase family metal-dependent hydrolase